MIITPNDAYKILKKKFSNLEANRCTENKEYYLFSTIPLDKDPNSKATIYFDSSFLISKLDGSIKVFKPNFIRLNDNDFTEVNVWK